MRQKKVKFSRQHSSESNVSEVFRDRERNLIEPKEPEADAGPDVGKKKKKWTAEQNSRGNLDIHTHCRYFLAPFRRELANGKVQLKKFGGLVHHTGESILKKTFTEKFSYMKLMNADTRMLNQKLYSYLRRNENPSGE